MESKVMHQAKIYRVPKIPQIKEKSSQYKQFPTISNHLQQFPTISNHYRPFPAISSHFRPFPSQRHNEQSVGQLSSNCCPSPTSDCPDPVERLLEPGAVPDEAAQHWQQGVHLVGAQVQCNCIVYIPPCGGSGPAPSAPPSPGHYLSNKHSCDKLGATVSYQQVRHFFV